MTYNCLIVDDELHARELIRMHVSQLPEFNIVGECESALEASSILRENKVDILFLDIEMPVLKGNELLKSLSNPPKVVFTTAHRNYAIEAFDLNVLDYLLKPITFSRFYKTIEKFRASLPANSEEVDSIIHIKKDRKVFKLDLSNVIYVESIKDYIRIHQSNADSITIKQTLTSFYELLNQDFLRIHRSFIINTKYLTAFSKVEVELGEHRFPIGLSYRKDTDLALIADN